VHTFAATIRAEASRLSSVREGLERWLNANQVPAELRSQIVLATHEVAADAIEDAEQGDEVDVTASIVEETVTVEVTQRTLGDSRRLEPLEHERVRGRGLILVQLLMAHVEVDATPTGVRVRMRQPIRGAEPVRPSV
jgi:serine/threonine-protein kinase RsbW